MKSTITKLLALVLVFVMVAGVFAGCGNKDDAPSTTAPNSGNNEEKPADKADTLVFANDYMSQKFSPFFADTSYDQDAVAMTQVSLLSSDREGNVVLNGKDGVVIPYNGKDYTISNNEVGPLTQKLYDNLTGIQWGKIEDTFGWTMNVEK